MARPTRTLQLVLNPSMLDFATLGRFLPDPVLPAPANTRSKVWFFTGDEEKIVPDTDILKIKTRAQDPSAPEVSIRVIGQLPGGVKWDDSVSDALRIVAVFGRAHHAKPAQDLASPFRFAPARNEIVGTLFEGSFSAAELVNNEGTIDLYQAVFPTTGDVLLRTYGFNVAAIVKLVDNGQHFTLTFGHDPNMEVGS